MSKRYGLNWPDNFTDLQIEFKFVRSDGYITVDGKRFGEGPFFHCKAASKLLWPEDDEHRWSDTILRGIVENEVTVVLGASDSGKTYTASKWVLIDYWSMPDNTLTILSSTEARGLELRIWGNIKEQFNKARERFPWLTGTALESQKTITTDRIDEKGERARSVRRGIICVPSVSSDKGLAKYIGIKQGRLRIFVDEAQACDRSFLDAYANFYGKEKFKGVLCGNPQDLDCPLCIAAEPKDGWASWTDSGKTQEWKGKWYDAQVVALDGRDSPNLEFPEDQPVRFPYLIGRKKLKAVAASEGEDSDIYWSMCIGKPRPGSDQKRVITRQICEQGKAFEKVIWMGTEITDVVGLDAAYGGVGGDRCVLFHIRFGKDVDSHSIVCCNPPILVPVRSGIELESPENQIAKYCMRYCQAQNVPPENFFFDGRATLGMALSLIWSTSVNVVDFGGVPSKRPVSQDEMFWEGDTQTKRLKRCDEHYSKHVSELWFSARYLIVSKQLRELPLSVAEEGWKRKWEYTSGNRIEVETKAEMKKRTTRSPDLFDALVIAIEGARRLGFQIQAMKDSGNVDQSEEALEWLEKELSKFKSFRKRNELQYDTK